MRRIRVLSSLRSRVLHRKSHVSMDPGTFFCCRPLEDLYPPTGLHRTASTYEYGSRLETQPDPAKTYVLCNDGSIQDMQDPKCPIGWELLGDLGDWRYRVTQFGFEPKKCEVIIRGAIYPVPDGKGFIGSRIFAEKRDSREVAFNAASQNAQMTENDEDEEGEVTSSPDLKP